MSISGRALKNLRATYLDQQVIVYLKNMQVVAPTEDGNGMNITAMISGLVVDIDSDFYHLGLPDSTILKSVPIIDAGLIEIMIAAEDQIMFELPNDGDEVH